jgi:hypothetical protein
MLALDRFLEISVTRWSARNASPRLRSKEDVLEVIYETTVLAASRNLKAARMAHRIEQKSPRRWGRGSSLFTVIAFPGCAVPRSYSKRLVAQFQTCAVHNNTSRFSKYPGGLGAEPPGIGANGARPQRRPARLVSGSASSERAGGQRHYDLSWHATVLVSCLRAACGMPEAGQPFCPSIGGEERIYRLTASISPTMP